MNYLNYSLAIVATLTSLMANAQNKIEISARGQTMTVTLADTEAARQLKARIDNGSFSVRMNDYGNFEKVGELPWPLPASDRRLTASVGDAMLYQGMNIVIFYGSNSWSYTPLGRIDNASEHEIRSFLSGSAVDVVFSNEGQSAIGGTTSDTDNEPEIFTLQGNQIRLSGSGIADLPKGIYIINGKKQLIN